MASYSETLERNLNKIGSEDQVLEDIEEMEGENMEECNDNNVGGEAVSCPVCGKWIKKSFFAHLGKSKHCKKNISPEDLLKFENIQTLKRKMDNRTNIAKFRKVHPEKARKQTREGVGNFRKLNPEKARKQTREGVGKVRKLNPEKAKKQTREGFAKFRKVHPEKARKQAQEGMAKLRRVDGEEDRLYNFRVATLYGPIFSCISCHERKFQTSVQNFNERIRKKVGNKIPLEECIYNLDLTSGPVKKGEDSPKKWICKTCLNSYLLKGKLPPNSVMNGLKMETSKQREEKGMDLTDFESSLVAKKLMFQKIFMLPGSRWAGVMDKQILIPVSTEKVQNFLGQLPRTPREAGLLPVNLKRKLEYKGAHKSQLINPQKLFKFIATCKAAGHPLYQDVSLNIKEFEERCKKSADDYKLVFGDDEESDDEDVERKDDSSVEDDSEEHISEDHCIRMARQALEMLHPNMRILFYNDDKDDDEELRVESNDDSEEDDDFWTSRQVLKKLLPMKTVKIYKDDKIGKYLRKLEDNFISKAKLENFEITVMGEREDEDEDYDQTSYDIMDRFYYSISTTILEILLEIVEEFANHDMLNAILDEALGWMIPFIFKYLINIWKALFIVGQDHHVVIQHDDQESLEELMEKQMEARDNFEEKMGFDLVDTKFIFDLNEMDPETVDDSIRWIPKRAFSRDWILDEISENSDDWCDKYATMMSDPTDDRIRKFFQLW